MSRLSRVKTARLVTDISARALALHLPSVSSLSYARAERTTREKPEVDSSCCSSSRRLASGALWKQKKCDMPNVVLNIHTSRTGTSSRGEKVMRRGFAR